MRYIDFRDGIQNELLIHPDGLTWVELKERLHLPYESPCQTWIYQLEKDIGLIRQRGNKRAYTWKVPNKNE